MGIVLEEERMSVSEQEQLEVVQDPALLGLPCRVVLDVLHDRVCRVTGWLHGRGAFRTVLCPEHRKELDAKYAIRHNLRHSIGGISCPGADIDAPDCQHGDFETSDPYTPGGCWGWYPTGRTSR